MSSTPPAGVTLVYDDAMASYRFSDRHPMNPERLGLTASTRASTYLYNTTSDVDTFLAAVAGVQAYFGA